MVALSQPCNKFPIVAAMATKTDPHIFSCLKLNCARGGEKLKSWTLYHQNLYNAHRLVSEAEFVHRQLPI